MTCITQWRNSTVHCVNELYCIFIIKNKETDKETDTYSTFDPHEAERMTQRWKKLLQGIMPLLYDFVMNLMPILLLYFSSYTSIKI